MAVTLFCKHDKQSLKRQNHEIKWHS